MRFRLLTPNLVSLPRGILLVSAALGLAIWIAHPPDLRPTLWLIVPLLIAMWGAAETARCMHRRWDWYHGGVLLLLYADLMVTALIAFFLLYPFLLESARRH